MKRAMMLLACVILIAGCATAHKMNNINIGMTKQEVIAVMGKPYSTSATEEKEYFRYILTSPPASHRYTGLIGSLPVETEYFVRFINSKVNAYGKTGDFGTTRPVKEHKIDLDIKHRNVDSTK